VKTLPLVSILIAGSCSWNAAGTTGCEPTGPAVALPDVLAETSGVAWSGARTGVLLTHNDGGHDASVFALDQTGRVISEIPLEGVRNRDWEDIATAECQAGFCIYLADIGDNQVRREQVFLYRIVDSGLYDGRPVRPDVFPMVLPDGPRDMEAMFVLPGEEVYLVSKGRSNPVSLYRYPPPLRPGQPVTLEHIMDFTEDRLPIPRQVTGADASLDGRLVVMRSYVDLAFFQWADDRLIPVDGGSVALRTLNEAQGEGVALGPHGQVALTSEAARGDVASLRFLRCDVTSEAWRSQPSPPSLLPD
jgi:hypothetical protein